MLFYIYSRACHFLLFCPSPIVISVLSIHFAGRILVFHVQFLMERRHDDHVIVQLSAHEMQRTRMLRVVGRFVADQFLPSEVSIASYILYRVFHAS